MRGEGPPDFTELVLDACAHLLALSDLGIDRAEGARAAPRRPSPTAPRVATYERWIDAQGGDPDEDALPQAPVVREVLAPRGGLRRTRSARSASASPRSTSAPAGATKDDAIDHAVGVVCREEARRRGRGRRAARRDPRARRGGGSRGGRAARSLAAYGSATSRRSREPIVLDVDRLTPDRQPSDAPLRWRQCPSCPRSRRPRGARAACSRDGASSASRSATPRLTRPFDPVEVAAELEGERVARVDRRGKYLIVRFEIGSRSADPPPDDGVVCARSERRSTDDPHRRAVVTTRRRIGRRLPRRAPLRHVAPARAGRARAVPRRARSARSRSTRASPRAAPRRSASRRRRAPIKAALLDQRTLAGAREHLRRRGALARADPSAARRRASLDRRRVRRAAPRDPRRRSSSGSRARARRCATTGCRTARSGSMQHEFKVYGRGGEPCDRCGTPIEKIRVGGRGHVVLPALPARSTLRGEQLVEPAVAVEAPELGVAADRPVVDQDLRHRPAAGQVEERLPEGRVVVEVDLLVGEAAARRAAPWRGRSSRTSGSCTSESRPSLLTTQKRRGSVPGCPHLDWPAWPDAPTRPRPSCSARSGFGEADRILHLYTLDRGRIGAVAKGVRKTKSRFGARLEPLSHVELMLHQGAGELQTVTGVELIRSHQRGARGRLPARASA